ncbi:fructosamine kinase family protein [Cellulomonas fimi]|uniref:Fructosamine/Ketosamine-3-kinase n=1 Tax=Cellulomonas fimi (strain ATCC 484 / DSM 20113 / JCM 1341 / CCUG 24087 / LMG 16345 / NBRC 15513 / NCIMB 8980 / NCTC 7547 / NRS-133) TaxID=590998 RepID=F4GYB2_CELFA|nr:fructosamine kinase family protein [Cellulomonas fimi]AEE45901.1 Fructosamine/Ketosamine-3-kinase [Cellulomonas fimi ATCC 484]VEH30942.1 Fructosamine-3-kinase [Cellulomonas fimi]
MVTVFRKARAGAPAGFFACEAAGLAWLRDAGGVPVVDVLDVHDSALTLVRLEPVAASREVARTFGRRLAVTHDAGADAFGAPPPGWGRDGFFGPLDQPLPMPAGAFGAWGEFHATCRVAPVTRLLVDGGVVDGGVAAALDRLAARLASGVFDDDDVPARLHGDLWSGNVVWTAAGATLVDPAAHGGHRETDLAMLALFGLPFLDDVLAAYGEVHPLRPGVGRRAGLHQVYPVAVHALLFGGAYVDRLAELARRWGR